MSDPVAVDPTTDGDVEVTTDAGCEDMLDDNPINEAGDVTDEPDFVVQNVNISLTWK